jgi:DNA polymerase I
MMIPAALSRFREVWAIDFEYIAKDGERPDPVCCCALELRTGRELRLWETELRLAGSPIPDDGVMVAFSTPAELKCFRVLGWRMPRHVLDLYCEFRLLTNGRKELLGVPDNKLLSALAFFGLSKMDSQRKDTMRDRILAGRPYFHDERIAILEYCFEDVVALDALLPVLIECLQHRSHWFEHALLRGQFMCAAADIEHRGVPVDAELLQRLTQHWDGIKSTVIDDVRARYPVFEGTTLKHNLFEAWLVEQRIAWPRTPTGRLSLSEKTMRQQEKAYPAIAPIREVRDRVGKLRLTDLAVGKDGRNRCWLSPFGARSGRSTPSASKFIFAPSVWLRSLIKPEPGRALAYVDFSSQEIAIAAALSGDGALIAAYQGGDPYLDFAVRAGLAPLGATREAYKAVRDRCKALVLGVNYGMREQTLAGHLNVPECEARALLRQHQRAYKNFWAWITRVEDHGRLAGYLDTVFGWRLHVTAETKSTSLQNFPMQANGAEMLRLAIMFMVDAGVEVCAPVHDAVLIEAADTDIEDAVATTAACMRRASRVILSGIECRTDAKIIRWPDRYSDDRGVAFWVVVMGIMESKERVSRGDISRFPISVSRNGN